MNEAYKYANNGSSVAIVVVLIGILSWVAIVGIVLSTFIKWEISYETIRALIAFCALTQAPTVFMFFHKRMNNND